MKKKIRRSFIIGTAIMLSHSLLLSVLILLDKLGPMSEIQSKSYQTGGTILFIGIYLLLFVGIFIGIRLARNVNKDRISYKECVLNGVLISMFTGLTSILATIFLFEFVFPDYDLMMSEKVKDVLEQKDVDAAIIAEKVNSTMSYYSTLTQAKFSAIGNFTTGLFYTLVLSIFLKK